VLLPPQDVNRCLELHRSRLVIIGTPNRLSDLIEQFSLQLQVPERAVDYIRHQVQILVDRHLNEQTTRSFLEDTDIPTLVIHDRQDADTPFSNGEAIAAYSHRSHLVSTDSLGHQRILRSPQVIRTVASFLGGQSPDPRTAQQ
jgi:pimeloyl-ACP methyl ester carboxylesterase